MLRRIFLLIPLLWINSLSAQQIKTYTLSGKVLDEAGQPMPGAGIVDRTSAIGAAADAQGRFEISFTGFPVFLEASFIGYSVYYRELNQNDFDEDGRLELTIQMKPRSQQLQPAEVDASRFEEFYVHRNVAVEDFTFVDEFTLLLIREGRNNYKLALINEVEDSLALLDLENSAEGFIQDCLGHIYMQGKDSVYGLSFAGNKIHMIGAIDNEWYKTKVNPCVASNPSNLYYQFLKAGNQMMDIFQSPMYGGGEESKLIRRIVDWEDAMSIQEYGNEAAMLLSGVNFLGDMNLTGLARFKDGFAKMAWYKKILTIPVYHPLFTNAREALLFDHLHDSVLVLNNEGEVKERYFIKHHHNHDFKDKILRDAVTGTFYVYYEKAGQTRLTALSPVDFKPVKSYHIRKFDFPRALKVRNGIAYFLDHSDRDYQKLKLYRQKLENF